MHYHQNSGVGLSIGQRLIDEFLATRSLNSHLILIPTTRSVAKSADSIRVLRAHLHHTAETSAPLRSRYGYGHGPGCETSSDHHEYDPQKVIDRVHLLSAELDLCDLDSVYRVADRLVHGTIADPTGVTAGGAELDLPRLDAIVLNAGIGGWAGISWSRVLPQFLSVGLIQSVTYPAFKALLPRAVLDTREMLRKAKVAAGIENEEDGGEKGDDDDDEKQMLSDHTPEDPPELAEVFCANLFGHYILAHELMPLLARPISDGNGGGSSSPIPPGRVVWVSSIDAGEEHLDMDDFQARVSAPPYESSKRITDLITLSADLPSIRPLTRSYFSTSFVKMSSPLYATADLSASTHSISASTTTSTSTSPESATPTPTSSVASGSTSVGVVTTTGAPARPPRFCLSHPGVVCTPLFPLNWFLYFWYTMVVHLSRLLGSPWHVTWPYLAACAPAWLALTASDDELRARAPAKWGSACDRRGTVAAPKRTEVEGWGWRGRVGETVEDSDDDDNDDGSLSFLSKSCGRKWDATILTADRRARFEQDARRCWVELERLRAAWELALGRRSEED